MNAAAKKIDRSKVDPLTEAFPEIDPGLVPFGSRVLTQIRKPKTKSSGGIVLVDDTKETEKWNTQVAKIVSLGPLAFHNRDTMKPWPEGQWCSKGEFVRVPKYGGDRWEQNIPGTDEKALFVIFNDLDIIGKITGDPLEVVAFV